MSTYLFFRTVYSGTINSFWYDVNACKVVIVTYVIRKFLTTVDLSTSTSFVLFSHLPHSTSTSLFSLSVLSNSHSFSLCLCLSSCFAIFLNIYYYLSVSLLPSLFHSLYLCLCVFLTMQQLSMIELIFDRHILNSFELVYFSTKEHKHCILHCLANIIMCTEHYIMCTEHYIMCTEHYIMCTEHYIMCTEHYIMCTAHYIM